MEKMTNKKALGFAISLIKEECDRIREHNANCCPSEEIDRTEMFEVVEKLQKMLVQVEKKSGAKTDKLSKAQVENEQIKSKILEAMAEIGQPCQIKQICAIVGLSSQKVSALVRQMLEVGVVSRTEVKKVALFSIVSKEVALLPTVLEEVEEEEISEVEVEEEEILEVE